VSNRTVDLTATVSDADFGTVQSDQVTIDWYLDGSQVHSQTVSSNGTYTHQVSGLTGGDHTWHVGVSDSYGVSSSTSPVSFSAPSEILIFEETNPDEKVDQATVTIQFFGAESDTVVERSTSDGSLNMTGVPVDEEMTIVAEADEYYTRRIYIESIYDQAQVYLLNDSLTASSVVFNLDDQTDEFPADQSVLEIKKPIRKDFNGDGDNETRYQTIAGDVFGASGEFPAELEPDTRYRLTVDNRAGDTRVLGSYTVSGDASETLTIGSITFGGQGGDGGAVFQSNLVNYNGSRYVKVSYLDDSNSTDELSYEIYEYGNESNVLQSNTTVSGPIDSYSATVDVPASAPDDVSYAVKWHGNRSEADEGGQTFVGDVPQIAKSLNMDPTVLAYASYVFIAAITGLVVIYDDKIAAGVAVFATTGLTLLGAISVPPLALGVGGVMAVLYNIGRN
jgi:hypothetical protein